jgi:hypothetical protein
MIGQMGLLDQPLILATLDAINPSKNAEAWRSMPAADELLKLAAHVRALIALASPTVSNRFVGS